MKKRRISTTISAKHWDLLEKFTKRFETQQKVLELALENLEKDTKQNSSQPTDEQIWTLAGRGTEFASVLHIDAFRVLLEGADVERIIEIMNELKMPEHMIAWYYQKPLKKCSLKEVMDGLIFFLMKSKVADMVNYSECDKYYILKMIHGLHIGTSRMFSMWISTMFESYGLNTECEISEKSLFMKIYKK